MKNSMTRIVRLVLIGLVFCGIALASVGHASADSGAGWYGPYDDGCYYYWDGYQWTGDSDCSAASSTSSGYAAGWYDAYGDGCLYYYDGAQYTGQYDCSSSSSSASSAAAGWYGPYDDGCYYYWDGAQWTGNQDCTATSESGSAAGWYGPYDDGCYYYWDGGQWAGNPVCGQSGSAQSYAAGWYGPYSDGCSYEWDGAKWTGAKSCQIDADTTIVTPRNQTQTVTTNSDGSQVINRSDGVVISVPADTGDCGNYCQTNIGDIWTQVIARNPVSSSDLGSLIQPETRTEYTPGCEFVREGYCYSTNGS